MSRRFTGTITDLDSALSAGETSTRVIAVSDGLGRLARRYVSDQDWPAETDGRRIARIVQHADVIAVPPIPDGAFQILPRAASPAVALSLAQTVARDALGVLIDNRDGTISYQPATARENVTGTVVLDACDVLTGSSVFQRIGDVRNRAYVTYGPDAADTVAENAASVARFGRLDTAAITQLERVADARLIAQRIVNLWAFPRWQAPAFTVALDAAADRQDELAELVIGDRLSLTGLMPPLPPNLSTFIEGWSETLTAARWEISYSLSDTQLSVPAQRWRDVPPAVAWQDAPAGQSWADTYTLPIQ